MVQIKMILKEQKEMRRKANFEILKILQGEYNFYSPNFFDERGFLLWLK